MSTLDLITNANALTVAQQLKGLPNVRDVRMFVPVDAGHVTSIGADGIVFALIVNRPTEADPDHWVEVWVPCRRSAWDNLSIHPEIVAFATTQLSPPPVDLRAYAAEKRWRVEVGGVPFGGLRLPSDDRAKTLIMGAAGAMSDTATAPFVVGSSVVTLTGAQFKAAHQAIVAHVQACFATQVAVLAAIDAGTIATTAQIDAAAWPANS